MPKSHEGAPFANNYEFATFVPHSCLVPTGAWRIPIGESFFYGTASRIDDVLRLPSGHLESQYCYMIRAVALIV